VKQFLILYGVICIGLQACAVTDQKETVNITSDVLSRADISVETAEWGDFIKYFEGESYGAKNVLSGVADINPGQEIHPPHQHAQEEYLMILAGQGTWSLNGKTFPAKTGDMLYASPWDVHGIKNTGDEVLSFVFWKWDSKGITPRPLPK